MDSQALLDLVFSTPVISKSDEQKENEQNLKSQSLYFNNIVERIFKLDILNDELQIHDLQKTYIDDPIKRLIENLDKPWLKDKITVGFFGHYSSGKTSALNCIFGEHFPIASSESTPIGTYLSYGKKSDEIRLVDKTGVYQVLPSDVTELFNIKTAKGFPFYRFFDYVQKENEHQLLKKISVLDTPGLFSGKSNHSLPAIESIELCDVVFWFAKILGGFDKKNIDFLKEHANGKKIYLVFTFVDNPGMREASVNATINEALSIAKEKEVEIAGVFKFGRTSKVQDEFKSEVLKTFDSISNEQEIYDPTVQLYIFLRKLYDAVEEAGKNCHSRKSALESEHSRLQNSVRSQYRAINSAFESLSSVWSNLTSTFNNRCYNATFCGGAASAMASQLNSLRNKIVDFQTAYNNLDEESIQTIGACGWAYHKEDEKLEALEAIKKELADLLFNDND